MAFGDSKEKKSKNWSLGLRRTKVNNNITEKCLMVLLTSPLDIVGLQECRDFFNRFGYGFRNKKEQA